MHPSCSSSEAFSARTSAGRTLRYPTSENIILLSSKGGRAGGDRAGVCPGAQISGEYGGHSALDADGWFATRDRGGLDVGGYLFIEGRADDTIIRGGENIAPAPEIEDVLLAHPGVREAAVIGVPDPEWGQRLVAVIVGDADPDDLRRWARTRLRSSKTPETIVFRSELPKTETGKLLRRVLQAELEAAPACSPGLV